MNGHSCPDGHTQVIGEHMCLLVITGAGIDTHMNGHSYQDDHAQVTDEVNGEEVPPPLPVKKRNK